MTVNPSNHPLPVSQQAEQLLPFAPAERDKPFQLKFSFRLSIPMPAALESIRRLGKSLKEEVHEVIKKVTPNPQTIGSYKTKVVARLQNLIAGKEANNFLFEKWNDLRASGKTPALKGVSGKDTMIEIEDLMGERSIGDYIAYRKGDKLDKIVIVQKTHLGLKEILLQGSVNELKRTLHHIDPEIYKENPQGTFHNYNIVELGSPLFDTARAIGKAVYDNLKDKALPQLNEWTMRGFEKIRINPTTFQTLLTKVTVETGRLFGLLRPEQGKAEYVHSLWRECTLGEKNFSDVTTIQDTYKRIGEHLKYSFDGDFRAFEYDKVKYIVQKNQGKMDLLPLVGTRQGIEKMWATLTSRFHAGNKEQEIQNQTLEAEGIFIRGPNVQKNRDQAEEALLLSPSLSYRVWEGEDNKLEFAFKQLNNLISPRLQLDKGTHIQEFAQSLIDAHTAVLDEEGKAALEKLKKQSIGSYEIVSHEKSLTLYVKQQDPNRPAEFICAHYQLDTVQEALNLVNGIDPNTGYVYHPNLPPRRPSGVITRG